MKVIVICGPTASGKTALSVELARLLDGEVISADSMQIYRELNIGTAKPDMEERRGVPHHMIDVASVRESYSVSRYESEGAEAVEEVISRGKTPIVCGGTGLYINALIKGSGFSGNDEGGQVRADLEADWERFGGHAMLARLAEVDHESAERLHVNDKKRVIRALEVYLVTGKTITQHNLETQLKPPRYESLFIGVCPEERQELYSRIDRRVDIMMEKGLLDEVKALYDEGLMINTAAQAIGYKELLGYLNGESSLEESVELIKRKSRNYAKRQLTWFGGDGRVRWIKYKKEEKLYNLVEASTKYLRAEGVL